MHYQQEKFSGTVLANKPSLSFSTTSGASATSAGTSRSGGSKLLFGEIDTSSDRSSECYASVKSFVLCDSSIFLRFWLEDKCRDTLLSHVDKRDLASLRLACHDFGVRAAPALFNDLTITFRPSTFTRPAKLAALDRLGFYVKTLNFTLPHSAGTFLPPLVDPETGAELSFTYTPCTETPTAKRPKYGDLGSTEILTRQWPILFHAATNVPAFIRAFSAFINLSHLKISCPGYNQSQSYRRSTVDYALISLRIAVERNSLHALRSLTLSPIHCNGLQYLSPFLGQGATPRSVSRWSRIQNLSILVDHSATAGLESDSAHFKLIQNYVRVFQANLKNFKFRWNGSKGPMPTQRRTTSSDSNSAYDHGPVLEFPKLQCAEFENIKTTSNDISAFVQAHKRTVSELNFEDVELTAGTWNDALYPVTKRARPRPSEEIAEIPIMLSPRSFPTPKKRVRIAEQDDRKSCRISRWRSTRSKDRTPTAAQKVRDGLQGCEEQLRKVLRGSIFSRR